VGQGEARAERGAVQTVALRLIVEREREINAFQAVEYWNIDAVLSPSKGGQEFTARMVGVQGLPIRVSNGVDAMGRSSFCRMRCRIRALSMR
jgi:DNA topoisomerase-1